MGVWERVILEKMCVRVCVCGIPIHIHLIYAVLTERLDGVGNLHHVCELACFVACVCVCARARMCRSERACERDTQTEISELMCSFVFVRVCLYVHGDTLLGFIGELRRTVGGIETWTPRRSNIGWFPAS